MSYQLMKHTQIMVNLSLNVVTKKDNREQLTTWTLVRLTGLIFWLWSLGQAISWQWYGLHRAVDGIEESILIFCEIFYLATSVIFRGAT
jgi:hypothetical protein